MSVKVWHGMACAARYLLPSFVRSLVPVGKDGMEEESRGHSAAGER